MRTQSGGPKTASPDQHNQSPLVRSPYPPGTAVALHHLEPRLNNNRWLRASAPRLPLLLRALPYVLFLAGVFSVFAISVDDSFITFRYAANALAGHGLVFNIGERVEGFSSPLHLLVCAALLKIAPALGVLFKAKLVSVLFGFAVLWQMRGFGRLLGLSERQTLLAQALMALNVNFALASVNGLETTLYASLLLASMHLFLVEYRARRGAASAFVLFLALLARPETLLIFVGMLGLRAHWDRERNVGFGKTLGWALWFLAPTLTLIGIRLAYYGYVFPNTYYSKNLPVGKAIKSGVEYLLETLSPRRMELHKLLHIWTWTQAFQLVFAPVFWFLAARGWLRSRRTPGGMLCGVCIAATLLFVLRSGGDWMPGWRFMIGVLPALALLQVAGLHSPVGTRAKRPVSTSAESRRKTFDFARAGAVLTLGVWLFSWCFAPHRSWMQVGFSTSNERLAGCGWLGGGCWELQLAASRYFHDNLPPGTVIAYTEMGYGPFHNPDKTFLDMNGLTDGQIAHANNQYKTMYGVRDGGWYSDPHSPLYAYLEQRKPEIIAHLSSAFPAGALPDYDVEKTFSVGGVGGGVRSTLVIYRYHPRKAENANTAARQSRG